MAEIPVMQVIDKLMPLLKVGINLVTGELNLESNVRNRLVSVTDQLRLIHAYLRDAETKAETDSVLEEWITQMREVSYRIEDAIDEYMFQVDNNKDMCGVAGALCYVCDFLRGVMPRRKISSEINWISESIERLNKAKGTFELKASVAETSTSSHWSEDTPHHLPQESLFTETSYLPLALKVLSLKLNDSKRESRDLPLVLRKQCSPTVISTTIGDGRHEKRIVSCSSKHPVHSEGKWIFSCSSKHPVHYEEGSNSRHIISSAVDCLSRSIAGFESKAKCMEESRSHLQQDVTVEDKLVGYKYTEKVLRNWLLEKESARTVISVVGDGGLGKTTIVNKVFNELIKERAFQCYAWVSVSHSLWRKNVSTTVIENFETEDGNNFEVKKSEIPWEELRSSLDGRRYVIVFDDVWKQNFLRDVDTALPKDQGKIIITTRDSRVVDFCRIYGPVCNHKLKPLSKGDARKLFYLNAFNSEDCPKHLRNMAEEFVGECGGVPLAIVVLACLLSTKNKNVSKWRSVKKSLTAKRSSDPNLGVVQQVLSVSYQDLNYRLKSCLLYFGLFPEGYSINSVRLINLWIAEGFVENKEVEGQTLEEVAEEYLNELVARGLVKVTDVYLHSRKRRIQVHDLVHDFILKKCLELNFCQVKKSKRFKLHQWPRRLSIDASNIDDVSTKKSAENYGQVRSCILFNTGGIPTSKFESLFSSFKLLVRLDCEDAPLSYLPTSVGDFFNLKYLSLRKTQIRMIPKFIGNLRNLETLDLKYTYVTELPAEIKKLIKLHHLLAYPRDSCGTGCVKVKKGIKHLTALQKLRDIDVSDDEGAIMSELKNLEQMVSLGVRNVSRENGKLLCSAIENMSYLCTLAITARTIEVLDLESLSQPPQNLQCLQLTGCLEKLPHWISELNDIVRLHLNFTKLKTDPLPFLKDLSALQILTLWESYEGEELHFQEGWMNLKVLVIYMPRLVAFKIDEGVMLRIKSLHLLSNDKPVMNVPSHVEKVMISSNITGSLADFSGYGLPENGDG